MSKKLVCPFCEKPLQPTHRIEDEYFCENYDCPQTSLTWVGTSSLWKALADTKKKLDDLSDKNGKLETELDRTRKALDVAKDTIRHADWFFDGDYVDAKTMHNEIKCAIKGITALEQKDK